MRLRIDATPEEFRDKGRTLVKSLAARLSKDNPELAEALQKALELPPADRGLRYPALDQLRQQFDSAYEAQLAKMLADIGEVLDQGITVQKV